MYTRTDTRVTREGADRDADIYTRGRRSHRSPSPRESTATDAFRENEAIAIVAVGATYDWLVMQHKLNCIGRQHTPISPVSHGHRAALSDALRALVCVRACVRGREAPRHA